GDFAYVIWDEPERELFLARDPFGCRPLYFARLRDTYIFSSDIGGVLAHPSVTRTINEQRVAGYLTPPLEREDPAETCFHDVSRLGAGCWALVSGRDTHIQRYYDFGKTDSDVPKSELECAERLRELLLKAVSVRLR